MAGEKVALVTDSTCDLPDEFLEAYDVRILPLRVLYADREYDDRLEINSAQVIKTIDREIPRTSMPSPARVKELFDRLVEEGFTHVIAIHLSTGLSGTRDVVRLVAQQFKSLKVEVVDSKSISMGVGFLVREAGMLIKQGLPFEEIHQRVMAMRERVHAVFIVRTLEYLRRNGRIGLVPAAIGSILDFKPIISINQEGKYYACTKVRGWKKALGKIVEILREKTAGRSIVVAVMHSGALEDAQDLYKRVKDSDLSIKEIILGEIGAGMIVHSGPGLVGLAFYDT